MRKILLSLLLAALVAGSAQTGEKKWRVAMSNDYAGNSWRQTMISDWKTAAETAVQKGIVSEAPIFTTNESSASEQAAQLQSLILEGYDAIVLNAASPEALNQVVQDALDAGIVVVSFDNVVTNPNSWRMITDFEDMGAKQIEYVAKRFPNGGNLLEIRGIAGTYVNDAIHRGSVEALKKYPNLKVVGEVHGEWTSSVTQKAVAGILPSLPEVIAVVTQGGDGYGAVKAFEAAGKAMPVVIMGNRYDEMKIWKEMYDKTGYDTISISPTPAFATIAFWEAIEILNKTEVPKELRIPTYLIDTHAKLDRDFKNTPEGGVASIVYTQEWVREMIANAKAGKLPPPEPE
ncbi:MAG: ABC transporter substrate-binding protein [Planctomycetota bacterium]|jgi:ribose transport system substrate-binding protein|nr:ABC transporter substrate-binding protein [Planctomycetota bacterium]